MTVMYPSSMDTKDIPTDVRLREQFEQTRAEMRDSLRKQIDEAVQMRNRMDATIKEMEQVWSAMTGEPVSVINERIKRVTHAAKLFLGGKLYQHMKQNPKKKHTSDELEALTDGYPVRNIYEAYNEANPKHQIVRTGERAMTRYHVN
jgi:chromosome segregation ATPase